MSGSDLQTVAAHMSYNSGIFFKKNQQFITRSARADRGSYFVTTYRENETTWRLEKGKEKERKKERKKKETKYKEEEGKYSC